MSYSDERRLIQDAMRQSFPQAEERVARFYQMMEYHLGWRNEQLEPARSDPGKLLRPLLALLACQAAGADPLRALPVAAGIQLIHDFSLIHDDIEDDSATRRGRPTVWTIWGMPQGINTGDGMFVIAHLAIHRLSESGTPPALVLDVLRRFSATILTICEGQFLDLSYERNLAIDEAAYLAMIRRKTAALIGAAAELGALVGGASEETARALGEFGVNLGLAFQVQDDVLGVWGDPEISGKPFAADLMQRKLSLPVIHALRSEGDAGKLAAIYSRRETREGDLATMLGALERTGARGYTERTAKNYHDEALRALERAEGDARTLSEIRGLAEGLVGRQS